MEQSLLTRVQAMKKGMEAGAYPPVKEQVALLTAMQIHLEGAKITSIDQALATLTYSEDQALEQMLLELPEQGGLLVASRIADTHGVTRSVMVNAVRKLESGGLVRAQSLGMKGTRIEFREGITAPTLLDALLARRRPAA